MNEVIRFKTLDGTWEVGGIDRTSGIWPEDLSCTWDDWGPKTARFTLKRETGKSFPDLIGFTPVEIERAGSIWEGFIDQTPVADENSLSVEALGWQDHGDDDVLQRTFVHARLPDWRDQRSFLSARLDAFRVPGRVEVGNGVIIIGWDQGTVLASNDRVGVTLDLGPGNYAKRIVVTWDSPDNTGTDIQFICDVSDIENEWIGGTTVFSVTDPGPGTTTAGTAGTAKRYVNLMLNYSGAGTTTTVNIYVRITRALVFTDTIYESSNESILKGSDVLKDLLPRLCPLWTNDVTGIDATLFVLPDFAPTAPRTFREYVGAVNSLHGYVTRMEAGRVFRFKPQPTVPQLQAAKKVGVKYSDTSKNATRDVYNKAIAVGTGPDGAQLTTIRYASQQPNVLLETVATPVPDNPSFTTNTTSWTVGGVAGGTITRDTAIFDTSPASGRWDLTSIGNTLTETFTGTFLKGRLYILKIISKKSTLGHTPNLNRFDFGLLSSDYTSMSVSPFTSSFFETSIAWVPSASVSGVQFMITRTGFGPSSYYVDSLSLWTARPTLPDKRGFFRSKAVSMPSQGVADTVLQQLADIWLQAHMRTPARGNLVAQGRALTNFTTGETVDPFEVGQYTSELVNLSEEIDPDTGALGRYVPIANVSYDGNTETATVSLDSNREDFEKVVARYDVISSGGGPS